MNPRHSYGSTGGEPPDWVVEYQAAMGHAPSFDNQGRMIGFKSRPGAPLSSHDTMHGLGIAGDIGTDEHASAWKAWFHPRQTTSQPFARTALDANDDSGMPAINPHVDPVGASIAAHSNWLRTNGYPIPVSPAPLPPSANMMRFPSPLDDPARFKSAFVNSNGIQPGYADAVSAYNRRLYAPADTQQNSFATPAPTTNWNRTGWNGPTQPVTTGNYTTPYGSASVNFGIPAPPAPADNSPWGWNSTS